MTNLTNILKSTAAAIPDVNEDDDLISQLSTKPDVETSRLLRIIVAQQGSPQLDESNIAAFIRGLPLFGFAIPTATGGHIIRGGQTGFDYIAAMTWERWAEYDLEGKPVATHVTRPDRDLLEQEIDERGFRITRFRASGNTLKKMFLFPGVAVADGLHPTVIRFKGDDFKAGQALSDVLARSWYQNKFCPPAEFLHILTETRTGDRGNRWAALKVARLGRRGEPNGPPRDAFRAATQLRLALEHRTPFESPAPPPEPPDPPPAIDARTERLELEARERGLSDIRSGKGAWERDAPPIDDNIPF
jgi:hypothetical protein